MPLNWGGQELFGGPISGGLLFFTYLIFAQHLVFMFEGIFDMETCDLKQSEKQKSLLCLSSELNIDSSKRLNNFVELSKTQIQISWLITNIITMIMNCRLNH